MMETAWLRAAGPKQLGARTCRFTRASCIGCASSATSSGYRCSDRGRLRYNRATLLLKCLLLAEGAIHERSCMVRGIGKALPLKEQECMALYQFYRLNSAGEILAAPDYRDCPGDGAAHVIAASLVGHHAAVEIWVGTRLVGRFTLEP